MVSFNDELLSGYRLSIDKQFKSASEALEYLLKDLPLAYDVSNGVYIIYPIRIKEKPKNYLLSGRIYDRTNLETLPFSSILVNDKGFISDGKGAFSYSSAADSIFKIKISYLGYYLLDTIVPAGINYSFKMMPSVVALEPIIIESAAIVKTIQTGTTPGISNLNHKIAYFLPGNGDNSIFNLLRLQPGIMAAGEQSTDLMIWGSYEGQSHYIFDGFTLYGMRNFNNNISAINPFMAKDIKVLKGGYSSEYGERVGGIVDITGIDGNRLSPSAQMCINNTTINGFLSLPFNKKSALLAAYRQTYYDLYDPLELPSRSTRKDKKTGEADYYAYPDYRFRDINLKYSGGGEKSHYYFSLYGGKDYFDYSFHQNIHPNIISLYYTEDNFQLGASAYYGFTWKDRITSNLTVSYSSLRTDRDQEKTSEKTVGNETFYSFSEKYKSVLDEVNSRIDNKIPINEHHDADAGFGLIYYSLSQDGIYQDTLLKEDIHQQVPYIYLQDNITLLKKISLKPGIRADFHSFSEKIYFQPRVSAMYRISDNFRLNSAFGMYNQFVAKNMIIDESGNYNFAWSLCDGHDVPVLNSSSFTLGLSFNKNDYLISMEGYRRNTAGMNRTIETKKGITSYQGDAKTKGLDFFIKKEFKEQTVWVSYTLSETEEYFPYFPTEEYIPAMHDQRHEIKFAGLAKFRSFHFSANYVYGSGFPDPDLLPSEVIYTRPYSRLDASLIYKFSTRKIHLDAGISVLNVLNTENIKFSNYTRIPTDDTNTVSIYAESVPFTSTLFLHIYY
jgi:outer membrane receptor protein involved in Fe transport